MSRIMSAIQSQARLDAREGHIEHVAILADIVARKVHNARRRAVEAQDQSEIDNAERAEAEMALESEAIFARERRQAQSRHEQAAEQQHAAAAQPFPPIEQLELGEVFGAAAGREDRVLLVLQKSRVPGLRAERWDKIDRRRDHK